MGKVWVPELAWPAPDDWGGVKGGDGAAGQRCGQECFYLNAKRTVMWGKRG